MLRIKDEYPDLNKAQGAPRSMGGWGGMQELPSKEKGCVQNAAVGRLPALGTVHD